MKVYQLLQQGTNEQLALLMLPEGVTAAESKELPTFWELRDGAGTWFAVIRDVDIVEVPNVKARPVNRLALGAS